MLDNEYQQVLESFKQKRTVIQELQAKLSVSEQVFSAETAKEANRLQKLQLLEAKCETITREIEEQTTKKNRALQFARKASKLHRQKSGMLTATPEEEDFMIRAVREMSTLSLQELDRLTEAHPDLAPKVQGLMQFKGLQPPSRSVSRVSSSFSGPSSGRNSIANERLILYILTIIGPLLQLKRS